MGPHARRCRLFGVVVLTFVPDVAEALSARVGGTFDAQYYQVSSPYGSPLLRRRRYTQTLRLDVNDLVDRDAPLDPGLDATVTLRLDTDLGIGNGEIDPEREDLFIAGIRQAPFDMMEAYVEGRRLFDGAIEFRVGRQYVTDVLGWWSFDGAKVRLITPGFVALEAYGGFEQRGGLRMLSTSAYEADGVWRGQRDGLDENQWPEFLGENALAPAYGFAVASAGISFLDARATYGKVLNRDRVVLSPFPDDAGNFETLSETRTSTERIGGAEIGVANVAIGSVANDGQEKFCVVR
jgi:hypothetical protein